MDHRAVIAEIAGAGFGMLGDDYAAGDVFRPVGREVLQHRQGAEVDVVLLHAFGDRPAIDQPRRQGLPRACLIGFVQPVLGGPEHPGDPLARSEGVGNHFAADAFDVAEMQERRPALLVELPDERRRVLIVRDTVFDGEYVFGIRLLVFPEKVADVLAAELHNTALRGVVYFT